MNHFVKWLLTINIFISFALPQINFDLPDDSASFGILICDYETSVFEEGTVLNVPLCTGCDSNGFPLEVLYQSPGDFGWIQFNYTETGDTVFYGTIVWMGLGEINFPDSLYPADSFYVDTSYAADPDSIHYWSSWGASTIEEDVFLQSAAASYEQIRNLAIVHEFAEYPYQIVAFMYTPTVGATDLTVAKWIFFLFRNPEVISVNDETPLPNNFKLYQPYPNPFNPTTAIRFSVAPNSKTSLQIFDITGRLVDELVSGKLVSGEHEVLWNAGNNPSGVYFVRLESGEFVETQKILLIK
ncbi:MAG: T9SS type A sorting domain-containing protein [Candidatus Marinimicrobia bacterium]|nr:T9SS type A sorting domain-containing protein [Candidatus Neomarinimicrobiota bacterium]